MKFIKYMIVLIILLQSFNYTYSASGDIKISDGVKEIPIEESSFTSLNGKTCHKFFEERYYLDNTFDHADHFKVPAIGTGTLFGTESSKTIFESTYINHHGIAGRDDFKLVSNYMPDNLREVLIFSNKNFSVDTAPATRTTLAGKLMYNVYYHAEVTSAPLIASGTGITTNWYHTDGIINGNLLQTSKIDDGHSTKYYNAPAPGEHNECFNIYVSFCGDGVVDSAQGETCDPTDPNKVGWGDMGCSTTTCQGIESKCTNLAVSQNSGITDFVSNFTCTGTDTNNIYKIELKDGAGNVIYTSNTNTGSFNFTNIGNYSVSCYVNNKTNTQPACIVPISRTRSGGGSSAPICQNIQKLGSNQIKCIGDSRTKSFKVDCGNGDIVYSGSTVVAGSTNKESILACPNGLGTNPICYVTHISNNPITISNNFWYTTPICTTDNHDGPSGGGYCGNGIVEPSRGEECERAFDGYGNNLTPNCDEHCHIITPPTPPTPPIPPINTKPLEVNLDFLEDSVVIGKSMNPFKKFSLVPYIKNISDKNDFILFDWKISRLCVINKNNKSSFLKTKDCVSIPGSVLHPKQKIKFNYWDVNKVPAFISNINFSSKFQDVELATTLEDINGNTYENVDHLSNVLKVRVAKPSIKSTGGTSYIKNTTKISDTSLIAVKEANKNKNFVGTSETNDLSSHSKEIDDFIRLNKIGNEGDKYIDKINILETDGGSRNISYLTDFSNFGNYNGIDNVYIIRNQNFEINNGVSNTLSGPRTYIIENGNLKISSDINYLDNITFIVKGGGDLIINNSVKNINGTYINIGGYIKGEASSTNEQLNINGSIYGNLTNLIDKRTFIESKDTGEITVGTVVSFGSNLFRKPAPLTATFIAEYLNFEKIAK